MVTCPHCGKPINEKKRLARRVFESSQKLYNVAAAATHPPASIPAHLPNRESHIFVPLIQSMVGGGFVGAITVIAVAKISQLGGMPVRAAIDNGCTFGALAFLVVAGGIWFWRVHKYDGLLIHRIEEATGIDWNQDGQVGQPEPQTVKVEVKEENSGRWQFAELRIAQGKLKELSKAILSGQTFAERTATDSGLSQEEFRDLRDKFIDRGWAQWNHPTRRQQGVSLTHRGRFILQTIAHEPMVLGGGDLAERYMDINI